MGRRRATEVNLQKRIFSVDKAPEVGRIVVTCEADVELIPVAPWEPPTRERGTGVTALIAWRAARSCLVGSNRPWLASPAVPLAEPD